MNRITRAHALVGAAALFCMLVVPLAASGSIGGSGDPEATASSVKKQVKKLKKKVKNLQQQVDGIEQQPGPQGPAGEQGDRGLPGQPGQDATNLFAYILDAGGTDTATVQYDGGENVAVAVVDPAGNNPYQVFFNQGLVGCVVQAQTGIGDPAGSFVAVSSFPGLVDLSAPGANEARVTFETSAGAATDTSFMITAFC